MACLFRASFQEDIGWEVFLSRLGTAESAQAFLVLDVVLICLWLAVGGSNTDARICMCICKYFFVKVRDTIARVLEEKKKTDSGRGSLAAECIL